MRLTKLHRVSRDRCVCAFMGRRAVDAAACIPPSPPAVLFGFREGSLCAAKGWRLGVHVAPKGSYPGRSTAPPTFGPCATAPAKLPGALLGSTLRFLVLPAKAVSRYAFEQTLKTRTYTGCFYFFLKPAVGYFAFNASSIFCFTSAAPP